MTMPVPDEVVQGGLSEEEKRKNVVRLAFLGDEALFEKFCQEIEAVIPPATTVTAPARAISI